jgi:predicted lipoprotein with Yx(FWY)xxD motif
MNARRIRALSLVQARHRLLGLMGVALAAGPITVGATPSSAARAPDVSPPTTIVVEKTHSWGPVLALSTGWTVYRLTRDPMNKSTCEAECAKYWPPVVLAPGQKGPVGKGVGHLGILARPGGVLQVTYEGIPLYRFAGDTEAGQINGNVKNSFGQWWVVNPYHPRSVPQKQAGGQTTATTNPFSGGVAY